MSKTSAGVSPFLTSGLLQSCYFLDSNNQKHVRVGFFQTQIHGLYTLLVRFFSRDVNLSIEYNDYVSLLIHQPSVGECLRKGRKLLIHISDDLSINCIGYKVWLRSKSSSVGICLTAAEWNTLDLYTPTIHHYLQHLHLNCQVYLTYIQQLVKTGELVTPPVGLPTSVLRSESSWILLFRRNGAYLI